VNLNALLFKISYASEHICFLSTIEVITFMHSDTYDVFLSVVFLRTRRIGAGLKVGYESLL
jgi:hypothetical protein